MISIIVGTNRKQSKSFEIALYYQKLLKQNQQESQIVDLSELPPDFIFSGLYGLKNEDFETFKKQISHSEKFVFIIPEYNNSFPGVLKAFIDGLSYPNELMHKKSALVGISDGVQGNTIGLSHFVDVLNYLGMNVIAQRVRVPFLKKNWLDGEIQDNFIKKLFDEQVEYFIKF